MSEAEKVVLIRTILSGVEEIMKDKSHSGPGPTTILTRLRRYTEMQEKNPARGF
jgi:hypothetical protein